MRTERSVLPLPITVDSIDAQWLTIALDQRYPGVEVVESRIDEVISGTSTKIRVALRYNAAGREAGLPPTMIVKGGFEEHSPLFGFMYRSEIGRLAAYGVATPPSFDEAWARYRRELAYGLFIFLINETRFQTEETNTACAVRFAMAAIDHRTFELLLNQEPV